MSILKKKITPDISTDKLNNKLLQFFDENRKKGKMQQGWKEFRLNKSRKARRYKW